jgi:hypothetical protein
VICAGRFSEVNVKASVRRVVGGVFVALGCCAVAFGGFLAWLVFGADNQGWQMQTLTGNVESGAAISAVIGVGAIALGVWLRRLKGGSN